MGDRIVDHERRPRREHRPIPHGVRPRPGPVAVDRRRADRSHGPRVDVQVAVAPRHGNTPAGRIYSRPDQERQQGNQSWSKKKKANRVNNVVTPSNGR